jgi:hypothetical protein
MKLGLTLNILSGDIVLSKLQVKLLVARKTTHLEEENLKRNDEETRLYSCSMCDHFMG